ncbi:MAG: tRNA (cytidine(34)-2'-O)-methyltransferase [Simkaniaceae bacterium]|nr:tRNA (cytidine(34)-2'-O)-methyltransferase [Simkaniaceae bacterium]
MKIVLFQPQIPQNTGNIVRTCKATGADLILVGPCGFKTSNRYLKRAGLDYWEGVNVTLIDNLSLYLETVPRFFLFSSKGKTHYTNIVYEWDDHLIFGSETTGLPESLLLEHRDRLVTIPMQEGARCLNLANSAAIGAYELIRQAGFPKEPLLQNLEVHRDL